MNENGPDPNEIADEQPPVLGSWRNVYTFVLALHVLIIYLFYRFGETYG